jgi:hypothetical protein
MTFIADKLVEDSRYHQYLGDKTWLVDDHRWAFYAWEKEQKNLAISKYSLIHVDHHWDGVNDFHNAPEKEQALISAGLDEMRHLVEEDRWISFDSFIAPALIRGFIDEVHFYCKQENTEVGLDLELLEKTGVRQYIHDDLHSLKSIEPTSPVIFDFCLDVFNGTDDLFRGELWPDQKIMELLDACKEYVKSAKIVTISLSFGYSGTRSDTIRLADLVVNKFLQWRKP